MSKKAGIVKIAITGGHATPGLALIGEIKRQHPQAKIFYFGVKYPFEGKKAISLEYKVVKKIEGVRFISLKTGRLQRRFSIYTLPALSKIPLGFWKAFFQLKKINPDLIVSFGGYVSTPVVVTGWLLGIPSLVHEQTTTVGLANKINFFFAKKIALAFPQREKHLFSQKMVTTGNLIRDDLLIKDHPGKLKQVASLMKKRPLPIIYVTGGKTGSVFINHLVKRVLSKILNKYCVVHQTGILEEKFFREVKKGLPDNMKNFYRPVGYLEGKEVGWALNHADLIISRAGANIVSELIFLKKPSILIPIPWSYKNEQNKNAELIKELEGGEILNQKTVTPQKLLVTIEKMIKNKENYIENLKRAKVTDGKKRLLKEIEKLL